MENRFESFEEADGETKLFCDGIMESIGVVMDLPAAQPERMRGRWNWHEDEDICNCSKCDFEIDAEGCIDPYEYVKIYKFCPNCGAQMTEGEE